MKKIDSCILTVLLFMLSATASAQINAPAQVKEYQNFITNERQETRDFIKQRDQNFAGNLRTTWKKIKLIEAFQMDTTSGPGTIPKYESPGTGNPATRMIPLLQPDMQKTPEEIYIPWLPMTEQPFQESLAHEKMTFIFYGTRVNLRYDPGIRVPIPSEISGPAVAKYWEDINATPYSGFLTALETEKVALQLNDWGFLQLMKTAARELYPGSENGMNLLTWYLLTKAGYKIKVGYQDKNVYLLMPSANKIYGINYFNSGGIYYYQLGKQAQAIFTYDKDFPDAFRIFDLNIRNTLNLGENINERTITFDYNGRPYGITLKYNMNSIEFYRDYPSCDIRIYFDAAVSKDFKESCIEKLKPLLNDLDQKEAVRFLMNFVQHGFDYITYKDQGNEKEKFNFPEETLFNSYGDSDDKAVFFACLVRELLGLRMTGIEYPGHVATAVCINDDISGDYISCNGRKFIIADPAYVNAPLGLTFPIYSRSKAGIIRLGNTLTTSKEREETWDETVTCGGNKGDNRQNTVSDAEGNSYVAGYFNPRAVFGSVTLSSANGFNEAFIARLDKNKQWAWARKAGGTGNDLALNIAAGPDSNLYVAGIFSGTISFETANLKAAKQPDIFLARYDRKGNLIWVNRAGLDTVSKEQDFLYTVSFSNKGKHLFTRIVPDNVNYSDYGISFDEDGNVYYTNSYAGSPGFVSSQASLSANAKSNIVAGLKEENDKMIGSHCEKTIAGFFAALNLARLNNLIIPGKLIQKALDKNNQEFRTNSPLLYQNFGKILVMKNSEGMITLKTVDAKPVTIGKVQINDNARFKIVPIPGGDIKIEILYGIKFGKTNIWYNLNSMRLFNSSGNLLFDYDDDHTNETLTVKKDILFK